MRIRARLAVGSRLVLGLALAAAVGSPAAPAGADPLEFLPVGDPIESELRVLDLLDPAPLGGRIALPRLHTRPLQRFEIEGTGAAPDLSPLYSISLARIERALARDAVPGFAPRAGLASTPRLLERDGGDGTRLEASAGIEGRGDVDLHASRFASGSGLHTRFGAAFERWIVFAHLVTGRIEHARAFADPIVPGSDLILHTEESYLGYAAPSGRWAMQLGRSRWHWGPGEEAALTLSRTSPALTGFAMRGRLPALRLDASALSATLRPAGGEQLAVHRLEWQALPSLRLGVTEMARYRSETWQPLYLSGVVPYILLQRIATQDEPDSAGANRNNVVAAADAAWRVAPGTRIYGELLVDDLQARTGKVPNKLAFQLGLEGAGPLGRTRVTWGTEYTRLSRFVYTSFFGRTFEAQGRPIGFFTGPDARRVRVRGGLDLGADWQVRAAGALTDQGESGLDQPFVPGSPRVESLDFLGVIERTRELELGVRWWPASGVDMALAGGYRWIDNQAHIEGRDDRSAFGSLELRLTR
ncbi:MAG TPA: hypothetical protein VGK89_03510 [Candidatus Eisenbacteria bacterium]|jgi:hypothetical protein